MTKLRRERASRSAAICARATAELQWADFATNQHLLTIAVAEVSGPQRHWHTAVAEAAAVGAVVRPAMAAADAEARPMAFDIAVG